MDHSFDPYHQASREDNDSRMMMIMMMMVHLSQAGVVPQCGEWFGSWCGGPHSWYWCHVMDGVTDLEEAREDCKY